jgi:hypothetical protein
MLARWWEPVSSSQKKFNSDVSEYLVRPFWPLEAFESHSENLIVQRVSFGGSDWLLCSLFPCSGDMDQHKRFAIPLDVPLPLVAIKVPKPWGQEIWHSGVEKRGVSLVRLPECPDSTGIPDHNGGATVDVPLPLVELALGVAQDEPRSSVVLLKELDPFDVPYYGELYTEIHTKKSEIYIVTGLGQNTCSDGVGWVKLGLAAAASQNGASAMASDLGEFEAVRSKVDAALLESGYSFEGQVRLGLEGIARLIAAKEELASQEDRIAEHDAWIRASAWFQKHALGLGDVVRVPTHTPHALQPGVRVVEFQTPDYERLILSSNQKVMTQSHWDVSAGISLISDDQAVVDKAIERFSGHEATGVASSAGCEHLVEFDGLHVVRVTLPALSDSNDSSKSLKVAASGVGQVGPFACYVVSGQPQIQGAKSGFTLESGRAYLLLERDVVMLSGVQDAMVVLGSSSPITFRSA